MDTLVLCTGNSARSIPLEAISPDGGVGSVIVHSGAPKMGAVNTVCGNTADEQCPIWSGLPVKAHWAVADPPLNGSTQAVTVAFASAYAQLSDCAARLLSAWHQIGNQTLLQRHVAQIVPV